MTRARSVATVFSFALISVLLRVNTAHAATPTQCVRVGSDGYCVEWDDTKLAKPGTSGSSGGSTSTPQACWWASIPDRTDPTVFADFGLDKPPPGAKISWQAWRCAAGVPATFTIRWVFAATPGDVAVDVRARLAGRLPAPTVAASPTLDTAAIIGVPSFVAVTNWTGTITDSGCAGSVCVTVTAIPTLKFSPGEPGSNAVACEGAGSRFDPAVEPKAQASAAGACVHSYRQRTGVNGRPSAWPGTVSVSWAIAWRADSGETGTLPAVTRSTALARSVQEVQTVVVGGNTP
jgi:hypothetical protein